MKRNPTLKKNVLKRDQYTCKKCGETDETGNILHVHHIVPLCFGGKDEMENMITLCGNCHRYAPNHKVEFEEYMKEECDGTMTLLIKAMKIVQEKYPELYETPKPTLKTQNKPLVIQRTWKTKTLKEYMN
jgi:hypothetical protein